MNKNIKPIFSFKPLVALNKLQKENLSIVSTKNYKYIKSKCLCENKNIAYDRTISEYDRFGMPAHYVICNMCGTLRLNPHMDDKSLEDFYRFHYRKIYTGQDSDTNRAIVFESQLKTGYKYYDYINKEISNLKHYKKVLEIGCSSGGILKAFQNKGHICKGVDYDYEYAEYGNLNGVNIIYGGIETLEKKNDVQEKFDLIILSHTLEHFTNIKDMMNRIVNLLNNNGLLFIAIPGLKNNMYYIGERDNFIYWAQNVHIWWFSKQTLLNFLINFDLKVLKIDEDINMLCSKNLDKNNIIFINAYDDNYKFIINLKRYRFLKKILHNIGYYRIKNKITKIIKNKYDNL
jgi:2-polyprenyl-3-methyl-5-hydroxy-6-metoxy-1,4-benzoquinol methylase